ncbi:MAG: PQQ-binding-like beta-propeller repeat protein [Patescibacteria group bacterium]|nr:PQQ-binding-like beta-propeller repeat protein [Patescibacteria group bacterium]
MKTKIILFVSWLFFSLLLGVIPVSAENLPAGRTIPKLPKTADDPLLSQGRVYPFWGPVCQRYTYSVIYSDKQGTPPEYVQIYFNGKMLDMEKADPSASDYAKGVKYIYKNVPNKFGSNFYYFEASNGLGKARESIIDSPDNGPVLFDSAFKNNEVVLIDPLSKESPGKTIWRYDLGEEWVGGVMLSDDGQYLAVQTSNHVYLFQTNSDKPLWIYKSAVQGPVGGDVKGGVAISADGSRIFAALSGRALMFKKESNQPIWEYNIGNNGGNAYAVDITKNGQFAAIAMAGEESNTESNVLILLDNQGKKLWQYHSSGNWHDVSFSADGSFIAGSTGCPDRRGYVFSKDSSQPIIISDPLSRESPVDEARLSADGNLIAFGAESGFGAVILMNRNSKQIVWKYDTPQKKSVRTLAITPDGQYIGCGTFGGDILIFNKDSSQPIEKLNINSTIGAFDIADDGSFFATGSTDKKVRLFQKGESAAKEEITLKEYVGELDISADKKFIAAGTSGSVYFFDTIIDLNNARIFPCDNIIEPKPEAETFNGPEIENNQLIKQDGPIQDNKPERQSIFWPLLISLVTVAVFAALTIIYWLVCRLKNKPVNKIILAVLSLTGLAALGLCVIFSFQKEKLNRPINQNQAACGNDLCEPDAGESKTSCPEDCGLAQ